MSPKRVAFLRVVISTRMRDQMRRANRGDALAPAQAMTAEERRAYYREPCPRPQTFQALERAGLIQWSNGWELTPAGRAEAT